MHLIERISNNIASKVGGQLNLDEDHIEVLAYGAFAAFQIIWSIALVIIFGALFDVLLESIIVSFAGVILRKFSGGAHATSPNRCALIGGAMSVGLGFIINKLGIYLSPTIVIIYIVFTYSVTYYCVYRYAPVDTTNKPIVKEKKRNQLKTAALRTTTLCLVITLGLFIVFFNLNSYMVLMIMISIPTGLINQAMSLTNMGHSIINRLDIILRTLSIK